ncbi:hypothetical protein [Chryseobacterium sp. c4a]|uniref:hypothetical protein n=1 Tax=Chryseobacterium sp. c4a TaxID=1573582 RepID=UPI0013580C7F|nr:hypothetical protein [Chryseobacterium sp. c4a]
MIGDGIANFDIKNIKKYYHLVIVSMPETLVIAEQYQLYKDANDPEILKKKPSLLSWKSFSVPLLDDWLAFNKPIYMAYGSNDIASDLCDLVPLYFIRAYKNNLTYKRYLNTDHHFFEVENGEPNHDQPHWEEVMNRFVEWAIQ